MGGVHSECLRFIGIINSILTPQNLELFSLPMPNCTGPHIAWIAKAFDECVSTPRQKASFSIGLLSTCLEAYETIPQAVLNLKRHSADGMAIGLLLFLITGDTCNAIGVILSGGLTTQLCTSAWFIFIELICILQYVYYRWIAAQCCPLDPSRSGGGPKLSAIPLLLGSVGAASGPYEGRNLVGTILGWVSMTCYISSRIPQVYRNLKRRRTDGLSIQFFICAVLQNSTYGASILLWDSSWAGIWKQLPWLLGSIGIILFDAVILAQFLYFGAEEKDEQQLSATASPSPAPSGNAQQNE
jgi:uncharacterized protein with PQ loop repeat